MCVCYGSVCNVCMCVCCLCVCVTFLCVCVISVYIHICVVSLYTCVSVYVRMLSVYLVSVCMCVCPSQAQEGRLWYQLLPWMGMGPFGGNQAPARPTTPPPRPRPTPPPDFGPGEFLQIQSGCDRARVCRRRSGSWQHSPRTEGETPGNGMKAFLYKSMGH